MKILLINTFQAPAMVGGAETAIENLAKGLSLVGHQVTMVSVVGGNPPKTDHGISRARVPHGNLYAPGEQVSLPKKLAWHWRNATSTVAAEALEGVLDDFAPDVAHTHNLTGFGTGIWEILSRRRIPVIHTLHDYSLLCLKTTTFRRGRSCYSQCLDCRIVSQRKQSGAKFVSLLTAPSRFVMEQHRQWGWFEDTPAEVVPNVPDNLEVGVPRSGPAVRFGYLGRLDPTKGLDILVAAANRMEDSYSITIAGKGRTEYERSLRQQSRSQRLTFAGFVPDRQKFFSEIDVLVVPSLWRDVAPMVIHEANSSGVPVIASSVGGLSELVTERTGWLVPPGDPLSLEQACREAACDIDGYQKRSYECIRRAKEQSSEKMVARYLRAYGGVVHN